MSAMSIAESTARSGDSQSEELYPPSDAVVQQAYIKDWDALAQTADEDFVGFWEARARELVEWYEPWTKVFDDSDKPFYKWFVGARTNIVLNALDRHQKTHRRNKLAIIWEGENGEQRTFSYHALNREVGKFASVLKALGVKRGDRVTIYMGRVPELPIAMLACAKIGAVHSVVYGGFSTEALHERIEDSQSRVVVTCDGAFLNGKIVELKRIADEAIKRAPIVEHVVVVKRIAHEVPMEEGRDMWWHELMALPIADPR
jgi:acetyl-CoA synthetase